MTVSSMTSPVQAKHDDQYALPRNEMERERLQNQQRLLTELFNGRLIIDKVIKLEPGSRILDSGTGSASWILDLAKNGIPEGSEIVGVDISTIMFPTEVHKNVSLYEMSSTDLPSSWDAYFDLVNQRFLIAALTKEQWKKIISKLFRALKPGGAIQILEVDHYKSSYKSVTLAATEKCDGYCNAIIEKRNLLGFDCCQQLPILLEEAGFKDIHVEVQRMPLGKQWGKLGVMGSEDWAALYRAIGTACLQEGGLGVCESRTEIDSVVEQAMKEWDETPGVFVPVYAMTARKPL